MKRNLLFIILCSISFITISAQSIKGKYISRIVEGNNITFILPQDGYKNKEMSSKLTYDMTYTSATDSVAFNFSFISKLPSPVDSIVFANNEVRCTSPTSMLFIDPTKGDKWKNRVSAKFVGDDFEKIRTQKSPCHILIYTRAKNDRPSQEYKFEISEKDWKKNMVIINKIFEVIEYSN